MRKVEVIPYDDNWPSLFQLEAKKIMDLDKENIINIVHIGSTSVPEMAAKPIIDVLIIVRDLSKVNTVQLKKIGYECHGENGIDDRLFLTKGGDDRTHHLHIFQFDNIYEIERHLSLKEYLIHNEAKRKEYSEMKSFLADKFPNDIESYINGKNDLVKRIEQESLIYKWSKL